MKISIVLPAYFNFPIGGYHVHYQLGNMLSQRGHDVTILFPKSLPHQTGLKSYFAFKAWSVRRRLRNRPLISSFSIDPNVRLELVADLDASSLPDADILYATSWQTAEALRNAPASRGRKYYVVFDYEYWKTASLDVQSRIGQTFDATFKMVATSGSVDEMIRSYGHAPVARISCGLDFEKFGVDQSLKNRQPLTLGFPLRDEPFKGATDAIEAASILRTIFPGELEFKAYGRFRPDVPPWIQRLTSPSDAALRQFYNSLSVFMVPSHFEGWGLPGVEAMACGAALVTADTGGSRDYAFHERTALVVPPKSPNLLAEAVARLIQNPELRERIATDGQAFVQRFEWKEAADTLESALVSK